MDTFDLIDREALKEELSRALLCEEPDKRYRQIIGIIDNASPVRAFTEEDMAGAYNEGYACGGRESKRPQGEWRFNVKWQDYECPFCNNWIRPHYGLPNFCSNCGAKMKGGVEND